jgi:flagellar hook-associated protein 1 FlgK
VKDVTKFAASDYQVTFSSPAGGNVTRSSDGAVINFSYTAATGAFLFQTATDPAAGPYTGNEFDGLSIATAPATAVVSGDRFLLKPFSTAANAIQAEFSSPRALAVASPLAGKMGATNTGSLLMSSLVAKTNAATPPQPAPVVIAFIDSSHYSINGVGSNLYQSGEAIDTANWKLTLQGAPKAGDTFTVVGIKDAINNNGVDYKLSSGNATALMNLRDLAMFDGSAMTDGYASLMSQIGIRVQSANYTSETSSSIAANLERDRTAVSGVNLDEEAAKLLQYQQAYQASAKMIQIANSIFDTLIQSLG